MYIYIYICVYIHTHIYIYIYIYIYVSIYGRVFYWGLNLIGNLSEQVNSAHAAFFLILGVYFPACADLCSLVRPGS